MSERRAALPETAVFVSEALRVYHRYQIEVVEALNLCPWARRARLDGAIAERVVTDAQGGHEAVLEFVDHLSHNLTLEIGILIFARFDCTRSRFERFVSDAITKDRKRHELESPPFAMAAFHPDADADLATPERLVPFIRRSPHPTIQLVRVSALESVRKDEVSGTQFVDLSQLSVTEMKRRMEQTQCDKPATLRARIAQANLKTVKDLGLAQATAKLTAIFEDRDLSRSRNGNPRG